MGNLALAYFNRVRPGVATATGGSWLAAFPASNVADVDRSKPARSTTAGTSDTKLNIDLGAAYPIRLIMLDAHNLSDAGQFKVKLGTSSGASDLYSGSFVNWLQVTDAESAITEYGASKGRDFPGICLLASTITARYVTVEFSDASNTAGHLDIGYLYAGPALLPAVNPEYGAWSDGWMDNSTSTRTPGPRSRGSAALCGSATTSNSASWPAAPRARPNMCLWTRPASRPSTAQRSTSRSTRPWSAL